MILTRYVFSETLRSFLLAFGGLSSVIFIAVTLAQLHKVQGVSLALLLQIFPSLVPEVLLITIPASLLLAVTFTIGRLAADNELNAMRANGVHLFRVLAPGLLLGALLSLACAWLYEFGVPAALYSRRNILGRALEGLTASAGSAVRQVRLGKTFIRFKDFRDGAMIETDIFLVDPMGSKESIRAREARLVLDEENARLILDLKDAMVTYHSNGRGRDVQSDLMFDQLTRDIDVSDRFAKGRRLHDMPPGDLWEAMHGRMTTRYGNRALWTEFHRRISWSAAPLFFAIAAGPLAMLLRRGGRVAALAAVVLPVFAAYFPLAIGGQRLADQQVVPPWAGVWAADAVLAAAGALTFRRFVRL
ncbi:MAG: permease YjgP/YjgQ family [Planctomycetota bacterium]|nr:MAG: permease YjgP/YjgQ family [Planctomycetota bacterium]